MSSFALELSKKRCQPCEGSVKPFDLKTTQKWLEQLSSWSLGQDGKSITRVYSMKNFVQAVQLIEQIAKVAEAENHHPDIHLTSYRKLVIELATHSIGGLSENDFILAAKIEELPKALK